MEQTQKHIVIIGNGIAGVTAARFIRKQSQHKITIISAETQHFFSRTALMYIYMGAMRYEDTKPYSDDFWAKNKIELLLAKVAQIIDTENTIVLQDGKKMAYDTLILACGSQPNSLRDVAGQDLEGVQGLYSFQDLQRLEQYTPKIKKAVIAGGGLIGIELAEMLHSRHIDVTFLVREPAYWANVLPKEEAEIINAHILAQGINLQLNSEIVEILPHAQQPNQVGAVRTKSGQQIDCQFVGLTAGVSPNIAWLKIGAPNLATQRGILVDKYLRSNIPNIYAIGDCAELQTPNADRRSIEAIWYTARMMGETVAHNICQPSRAIAYQPQLWFNSAKFFEIEYQVYGRVPSATQPDTQTDSLFWSDPKAEKSIRIVYQKNTEIVVGFNLLGIRYRHEVCEKWILTQKTLSEVLPQLSLANFDPEFSPQHEKMLCLAYQQKTSKSIALTQKRGLSAVWHFLTGK
jgi:NAD(P)H-nitrite reductase large subunit